MPLPITNMQLNMLWGISGANGGGGTSWKVVMLGPPGLRQKMAQKY